MASRESSRRKKRRSSRNAEGERSRQRSTHVADKSSSTNNNNTTSNNNNNSNIISNSNSNSSSNNNSPRTSPRSSPRTTSRKAKLASRSPRSSPKGSPQLGQKSAELSNSPPPSNPALDGSWSYTSDADLSLSKSGEFVPARGMSRSGVRYGSSSQGNSLTPVAEDGEGAEGESSLQTSTGGTWRHSDYATAMMMPRRKPFSGASAADNAPTTTTSTSSAAGSGGRGKSPNSSPVSMSRSSPARSVGDPIPKSAGAVEKKRRRRRKTSASTGSAQNQPVERRSVSQPPSPSGAARRISSIGFEMGASKSSSGGNVYEDSSPPSDGSRSFSRSQPNSGRDREWSADRWEDEEAWDAVRNRPLNGGGGGGGSGGGSQPGSARGGGGSQPGSARGGSRKLTGTDRLQNPRRGTLSPLDTGSPHRGESLDSPSSSRSRSVSPAHGTRRVQSGTALYAPASARTPRRRSRSPGVTAGGRSSGVNSARDTSPRYGDGDRSGSNDLRREAYASTRSLSAHELYSGVGGGDNDDGSDGHVVDTGGDNNNKQPTRNEDTPKDHKTIAISADSVCISPELVARVVKMGYSRLFVVDTIYHLTLASNVYYSYELTPELIVKKMLSLYPDI